MIKNGSNGHSVVRIPLPAAAGRQSSIATNAFRRTRIVCTLGPSCYEPGILGQMVEAGMDVARFNFSHGDYEFHSLAAAAVRAAAAQAGRPVALMQDLQGPKLRIGALAYGSVDLVEGRQVDLTSVTRVGDATTIPVPHPELIAALRPGDRVLLADGELELCVVSAVADSAICTVARGGLLGERKGIAVPGRAFDIPVLTEKDLEDLWFGRGIGFDFVALSFVRSAEDVRIGRRALERIGWDVPIVAKLETQEALDNLDGILASADAVMVARGDLGVELPIGEVPAAQKDIIHRANLAGVPVITATEMLQSMVTGNRPTRAEAGDVATAVWDGTDAVMLSAETSAGDHPLEAVRAMAAICRAAEANSAWRREHTVWSEAGSVASAVAHGAAIMADELRARAIVVLSDTGDAALRVSKAHPATPIIAATPCDSVARRMALLSGVVPLKVSQGRDSFDAIAIARQAAVASGLIRNGDRIVVVTTSPSGPAVYTDLVAGESILDCRSASR
jgi:pyruvate kinase